MEQSKSGKPHNMQFPVKSLMVGSKEIQGVQMTPTFFVLSPTTPPNAPCSLNPNEMSGVTQRYIIPYLKPLGPDMFSNSEIFIFYKSIVVHVVYTM